MRPLTLQLSEWIACDYVAGSVQPRSVTTREMTAGSRWYLDIRVRGATRRTYLGLQTRDTRLTHRAGARPRDDSRACRASSFYFPEKDRV